MADGFLTSSKFRSEAPRQPPDLHQEFEME